jgi:hypothetical protein
MIAFNGSPNPVDTVRLGFEASSAFWFSIVKYAGYAVAFGCALEAPETITILKRWSLLRFKGTDREEAIEDRRSWIVPLAAFGLLIIVAGIVVETYAEGRVSDIDALLRAHESDKITTAEEDAAAAIREAGSAANSADRANDSAVASGLVAEKAQRTVSAVGKKADTIDKKLGMAQYFLSDREIRDPDGLKAKLSKFSGKNRSL